MKASPCNEQHFGVHLQLSWIEISASSSGLISCQACIFFLRWWHRRKHHRSTAYSARTVCGSEFISFILFHFISSLIFYMSLLYLPAGKEPSIQTIFLCKAENTNIKSVCGGYWSPQISNRRPTDKWKTFISCFSYWQCQKLDLRGFFFSINSAIYC